MSILYFVTIWRRVYNICLNPAEHESIKVKKASGQEDECYGTQAGWDIYTEFLRFSAAPCKISNRRDRFSVFTGYANRNRIHLVRRGSGDTQHSLPFRAEIHFMENKAHVVPDLPDRFSAAFERIPVQLIRASGRLCFSKRNAFICTLSCIRKQSVLIPVSRTGRRKVSS